MACLSAGDPLLAALHLGVALRQAPSLAGAVLIAIGDRRDPPLLLVRAEALRNAKGSAPARPAVEPAAPAQLRVHEVPSIRWE